MELAIEPVGASATMKGGYMRRSFVMIVAMMTALGLVLVGPVGAAPAEKTTHEFLECFIALDPEPEASWFTGKDGKNWHVRGAENMALVYMWNGAGWDEVGTNNTVANWNARWMLTEFGPVPTEGSLWGDFDSTSTIGDFAGSWSWGDWPDGYGHGAGKSDSGELAKVTLFAGNAGFGDEPYPCPDPNFVLLEVIDPTP